MFCLATYYLLFGSSLGHKEHKRPEKIEKPVEYSYLAIAVAYFDKDNIQQDVIGEIGDAGVIGMIPDRFPSEGDRIVTDSTQYIISNILGKGTGSAVYRASLTGGEDVAIKFQKFENSERENSVETDYAVLKRASVFSSYFPKVYYLSGIGRIAKEEGVVNIRYMVMELLGSPVWSFVKAKQFKVPAITAASIGIQIVEIVEKFHSIGFIHGDIHLENMLFVYRGEEDENGQSFTDRVVLGDYGKSSMYMNPENGLLKLEENVPIRKGKNLLFLSPYEMAGSSYSRREDIFRLIESVARMVDERAYSSKFKPFQNNVAEMIKAKKSIQLHDIIPGIHPALSELYGYARSMDFTDRPNYEYITKKLTEVIHGSGFTYNGRIIFD